VLGKERKGKKPIDQGLHLFVERKSIEVREGSPKAVESEDQLRGDFRTRCASRGHLVLC
jgi:hypothetical protein